MSRNKIRHKCIPCINSIYGLKYGQYSSIWAFDVKSKARPSPNLSNCDRLLGPHNLSEHRLRHSGEPSPPPPATAASPSLPPSSFPYTLLLLPPPPKVLLPPPPEVRLYPKPFPSPHLRRRDSRDGRRRRRPAGDPQRKEGGVPVWLSGKFL